MGKEEQKEITAIFRESLKASLRLNIFFACVGLTLLGGYLENMRRELKDTNVSITKLKANDIHIMNKHNTLEASHINLEGRVGRIEDRWK